ncbi:hypothetical protein LTR70_002388 [Exophiala xenobiotica]|uniref:Metallo-beta-lactamase domain-containing protein n=1 Tax=Lithohypha guttulata TaxID=1690604 RepID=A0ABR0KKS1_9EURO|nr:hypothetical protein LTR24_001385 [Lithohypha guttulata]KAK5325416.1 hypothetical protein LTR70_002388 [Exophiala xenobiotica]
MVPRPLPYPNTHPNKGTQGANTLPGHFFAAYPAQNYEILRRIYWKRRGYFMAVNIPALPEVERISSSVTRILGGNPSKFTLQGTNTYLLGRGRDRILVDTAQGTEEWREGLYRVLRGEAEAGKGGEVKVTTCILTHWHHDHVMGVPDVRGHNAEVKVYKHLANRYDPDQTLQKEEILDIEDGQRFSVGSEVDGDLFEVETLHTPGHAKDHMCLLITKSPDPEEVGCIFTADNVLGHGTAVFENLAHYVSSLKLMKSRAGENRRAFPGHGAVINDARQKLDEYITHRQMREDEAMNVLCYGTTVALGKAPLKTAEGFPQSTPPAENDAGKELVLGKEWESMEMVKVIYRMYPENLWGPAEGGLLQVLHKLQGDGKVEKTEDGKWKASEATMKDVIAEAGVSRSSTPSKL